LCEADVSMDMAGGISNVWFAKWSSIFPIDGGSPQTFADGLNLLRFVFHQNGGPRALAQFLY
jgi:hypothetical protein